MKIESMEEIEERERLAFERVKMLWKDVSLLSLLPKVFIKIIYRKYLQKLLMDLNKYIFQKVQK